MQGEICKSQSSAAETLSQSPTLCPSSSPAQPPPSPAPSVSRRTLVTSYHSCWAQRVPHNTLCTHTTHSIQHKPVGPSAQTQIWQQEACLLRLPVSSEHSQRGITALLRVLPFQKPNLVVFAGASCSYLHFQRKKKKTLLKIDRELTSTVHKPFGSETPACVICTKDVYTKLVSGLSSWVEQKVLLCKHQWH